MKLTIEVPNFSNISIKTWRNVGVISLLVASTVMTINHFHWVKKCEDNKGYWEVLMNRIGSASMSQMPARSTFEREAISRYDKSTLDSVERVMSVLKKCREKGI